MFWRPNVYLVAALSISVSAVSCAKKATYLETTTCLESAESHLQASRELTDPQRRTELAKDSYKHATKNIEAAFTDLENAAVAARKELKNQYDADLIQRLHNDMGRALSARNGELDIIQKDSPSALEPILNLQLDDDHLVSVVMETDKLLGVDQKQPDYWKSMLTEKAKLEKAIPTTKAKLEQAKSAPQK